MSTQEAIDKAKELEALALDDNTPEGWDKVYFEQFKRAWRAAVAAIRSDVEREYPQASTPTQRHNIATRLDAAGLPQNIGMEWF